MLRIYAKAQKSPIHGHGLFAQESIVAGTVVWALDLGQDTVHTVDEVLQADDETRKFLLTYAYYCNHSNGYVLCGDDSRYVNHSETPNIVGINGGLACVAVRDIAAGEEIVEDYRTYDPDPLFQWSNLLFNPNTEAPESEEAGAPC